ncbi:MAG: glycosyltransferase family 1 protein [Rhodospirillaceae bacterium]|nr:glycosyltransferase family 1 protein [Rhodospirillaceae bacterium]MBT5194821.1 glycosyltransferase family 1 protein [Rhodospirillaceae bacterium]MBT5897157.1 glycosyltransferase family 1 protein [Rhodospirillaceae bacterium]MBT6430262.1 glycosyltransferase family 1 protein [Rhodospirillaceae bacterium]MBT7756975.1 glycosyltransferase family 1 protein [Rhodospirillaceae bacterium]
MRVSRNEYLSVFDDLQRQDPGFKEAGFEAQMAAYFAKSFIYGDSFTRAMEALRNEAMEVVCNAELSQKTWAADHGFDYDEDEWIRPIVWAQVADYKPDVIFIQGISSNDKSFLPEDGFRDRFPFVKAVIGFSGFAHEIDRMEGIDFVISGLPSIERHYRANDIPTTLLYHGFDASLLGRVPEPADNMIDFSFVGSTGLGYGENHAVRYWELLELCCRGNLELWGNEKYEAEEFIMPRDQLLNLGQSLKASSVQHDPGEVIKVFRESLATSSGTDLPILPLSFMFPERFNPAMYGLEMYETLRRSRVTLNRHFDPDDGIREIGNMRTFEATGIGACMLVNGADNAADLFEPDSEIVTFDSVAECAEKAAWLLANEGARAGIAAAGQRRALRDHSIENRCAAIHEMIGGLI